MIDRVHSIADLFRVFGSVIPRSLLWGVLGAIEGALLDSSTWELFRNRERWQHPYSVHVFGMVLGFSLVMRIQIAYQRFWEGATQLKIMSSKLGDAAMQMITFDEVAPKVGMPLVFDEPAFNFRLKTVHYCSLFHALSLIDVRQDDDFSQGSGFALNEGDPYLFSIHPAVSTARERARYQAGHGLPGSKGFSTNAKSPAGTAAAVAPVGQRVDVAGCAVRELCTPSVAAQTLGASAHAVSSQELPPTLSREELAARKKQDSATVRFEDADLSAHGGVGDRAERMPDVRNAALPPGWFPGKPVPLQQLVRARRILSDGAAATSGGAAAALNFNSMTLVDVANESARVVPRSVWTTTERGAGLNRTLSRAQTQSLEASSPTRRSRRADEGANELSEGSLMPGQKLPIVARRGASAPSAAPTGVSLLDYVRTTILLRPSRRAMQKLTSANCFDVIGGVSQAEEELLLTLSPEDRSYVVLTWLLRAMGSRLQVLVPMCIAAFVDCPPLTGVLCFFVCIGYMALNETAIELEHPFGLGANHLPIVSYQDSFNSKIVRLLDQTQPELGYLPPRPNPPSPSPPPSPPTRGSFADENSYPATGADDFV